MAVEKVKWLARLVGLNRPESPPDATVERKVRDLEAELEKTTRAVKGLQLEWEEVYDKVTHLMARITKRQKTLEREQGRADAPDALQEPNAPQVEVPAAGQIGTHSRLAEMRRRNGLLPR